MKKHQGRKVRTAGLAVAGIVGGFVAATTLGTPSEAGVQTLTGHEAYHYAMDHLSARSAAQDGIYVDSTLQDLLPNQEFSVEGAKAAPLTAVVNSGVVTAISPGAGYSIMGDDAARGNVVDPFSEDALWRVIELTVSVDEQSGATSTIRSLQVGLAMDAAVDYESFKNGLLGQHVLLPLEDQGAFRHNTALYNIAHSGSLLGVVGEEDALSFPLLEPAEERAYLGGITTTDDLFDEADEERPVEQVEFDRGVYTRED